MGSQCCKSEKPPPAKHINIQSSKRRSPDLDAKHQPSVVATLRHIDGDGDLAESPELSGNPHTSRTASSNQEDEQNKPRSRSSSVEDEPSTPKKEGTISERGGNAKAPYRVNTEDQMTQCIVHLNIPGLKHSVFGGSKSKHVPPPKFGERCLSLEVKLDDGTRYEYHVEELPGKIIPAKCIYKVRSNEVKLVLRKAKEESWEAQLRCYGLDVSS